MSATLMRADKRRRRPCLGASEHLRMNLVALPGRGCPIVDFGDYGWVKAIEKLEGAKREEPAR